MLHQLWMSNIVQILNTRKHLNNQKTVKTRSKYTVRTQWKTSSSPIIERSRFFSLPWLSSASSYISDVINYTILKYFVLYNTQKYHDPSQHLCALSQETKYLLKIISLTLFLSKHLPKRPKIYTPFSICCYTNLWVKKLLFKSFSVAIMQTRKAARSKVVANQSINQSINQINQMPFNQNVNYLCQGQVCTDRILNLCLGYMS